jgi:Cft2 family RNA processing exonuclease
LKFINLTRRTEIGANSYYLEIGRHRMLLDCGMDPKSTGEDALPLFKAIADRKIEAILISHAHQDHIGTLPLAMRRFSGARARARVFMTETTTEVGSVLLHNSVNVMTRQREEIGEMSYPLFTHREIDRASELWHGCPLRQRISIAGERAPHREKDALTFEFFDAGHVLGSTGVILRAEGRAVFYTGDVNFDDQTIMEAAVFPEEKIDVLIMECTRGDHAKPEGWTRAREEQRFADALGNAFERNACVLIPVFALGKTQEILAMLYKLRRQSRRLSGNFPIYIGGLSSKFTDIYDRRTRTTRRQLPRLKLMRDVAPFILNDETVRDTPVRGGRVYVLSSGMMIPRTLSNVFARRIIGDPKHSIFFVGYANPESPAGILRDAGTGGEVALDPDKPSQRIQCDIEQFQFSAHATRESLVNYAKKISPNKILLVHGDPPAVEWMRSNLSRELAGSEIIVPTPGIELEL